jgi:hypothetical protein
MAISYNTGTTATVGSSGTPSGTVTIPAGVLSGDTVFVFVFCFTTATGTLTNTLSSSATAPTAVRAQVNSGSLSSIQAQSALWVIKAGSSDHGATLTFGTTGGTGGSYWYNVGVVAYTGASTVTPVDVSNGAAFNASGQTGTTTTPSATTGAAGDWQIQFLGVGPPSGNTFTVPGSLTQRQAVLTATNAGLLLEIADSNASVGASGTGIGSTTWTCGSTGGNVWSSSFTVGLAAPASATPLSVTSIQPKRASVRKAVRTPPYEQVVRPFVTTPIVLPQIKALRAPMEARQPRQIAFSRPIFGFQPPISLQFLRSRPAPRAVPRRFNAFNHGQPVTVTPIYVPRYVQSATFRPKKKFQQPFEQSVAPSTTISPPVYAPRLTVPALSRTRRRFQQPFEPSILPPTVVVTPVYVPRFVKPATTKPSRKAMPAFEQAVLPPVVVVTPTYGATWVRAVVSKTRRRIQPSFEQVVPPLSVYVLKYTRPTTARPARRASVPFKQSVLPLQPTTVYVARFTQTRKLPQRKPVPAFEWVVGPQAASPTSVYVPSYVRPATVPPKRRTVRQATFYRSNQLTPPPPVYAPQRTVAQRPKYKPGKLLGKVFSTVWSGIDVIVNTLRHPEALSGTIANDNTLGGTLTLADTLSGTIADANGLSGTFVDTNMLSGTIVGWAMIERDIVLAQFNDQSFDISITDNGAPVDVSSAELDVFLKPQAGVLDSASGVVKLSTTTGDITVTNGPAGQATVTVPSTDLQGTNAFGFWRCDIVVNGKRNTAMFGAVQTTEL